MNGPKALELSNMRCLYITVLIHSICIISMGQVYTCVIHEWPQIIRHQYAMLV